MLFTNEEIRQLAKCQLTWADRNITFRRALKTMPLLQTTSNEQLVFFLKGEMHNHIYLFALTTEGILFIKAFASHQTMGWYGDDIVMLTVHEDQCVRINLKPGVVAQGLPDYVEIMSVDRQRANTFINLANLLCLGHLWGDVAAYCEQLEGIAKKVEGFA